MTIKTVDYHAPDAGIEFVQSLHETGFAVIRNHPVPADVLEKIYSDWIAFFHGDDKLDFLFDPENRDGTQQGFFPLQVSETAVGHSVKDLKEFFHVVPGGRIPAGLEDAILEYRKNAFDLGMELVDWLQRFSPLHVTGRISEPFTEMPCSRASLLRILHYPPLSGREHGDAVRAAAHEDINLITLLPVAEQPGLQVRDKHDRWVDVASIRGELVVNSGDMLQEATAGYYPSTTHRVVNPGSTQELRNVSRISMPFFLAPRADVVLSERYTAGSYLEERLGLINR